MLHTLPRSTVHANARHQLQQRPVCRALLPSTPRSASCTCQAAARQAKVLYDDDGNRKFHGVRKHGSKWQVRLTVDGKTRGIGSFDNPEAAARHRDKLILRLFDPQTPGWQRLKLNFDESEYSQTEVNSLPSLEELRMGWEAADEAATLHPQSKYRGVFWRNYYGKWFPEVIADGKQHSAGQYDSEEEAARAYDYKAYRLLGPAAQLNFPQDVTKYAAAAAVPEDKPSHTSSFKGVSLEKSTNKWVVQIFIDRKLQFKKRFKTQEEAARAYDKAVMELFPKEQWAAKLNFPEEHL